MRALLEKLQDLYGRGDDEKAAQFRLTDRGIWHPTPLAVLAAAIPLVVEANLLEARGRPAQVFDAGAGDGRLLAALALGLDATFSVRLGGLESDASLAATARERLDTVARWGVVPNRVARVAEGDFFDPRAYSSWAWCPATSTSSSTTPTATSGGSCSGWPSRADRRRG